MPVVHIEVPSSEHPDELITINNATAVEDHSGKILRIMRDGECIVEFPEGRYVNYVIEP